MSEFGNEFIIFCCSSELWLLSHRWCRSITEEICAVYVVWIQIDYSYFLGRIVRLRLLMSQLYRSLWRIFGNLFYLLRSLTWSEYWKTIRISSLIKAKAWLLLEKFWLWTWQKLTGCNRIIWSFTGLTHGSHENIWGINGRIFMN